MYSICTRYSSMWWLGEGRLHRFGVTLSWAAIINFWHIKLWYKQNCVLSNKKKQKKFPLGQRVHAGKMKVRGRGLRLQFWGTGPPTSLSFSCRTRTISPGSTPGAWSASPPKVIFCPCFMPLSTCTSRIFTSFTTFLPSHFLQRSFSLITSPGVVQRNTVRDRCRPRRHNHPQKNHLTVYITELLTFSVTISTHRLHLLDHPWGQLSYHDAHTTPPTCCTFLYSARLASLPANTNTHRVLDP